MSAFRQAAIGAFIVGGVALFAIALFWIGDRRQLFSESLEYQTEFFNLSGLAKGAKVRVSGMDAGEVLEIQVPLQPDEPFRVHFRTTANFQPILRGDSVASIQTDGIVGNKFLQVEAGTGAAPALEPGGRIRGAEPVEISDLLVQARETIRIANESVLDIRTGVDETVKAILTINGQAIGIMDNVGREVQRFTAVGYEAVEDVAGLVSDVRDGQGSIGKLLTDDAFYEQIRFMAGEGEQVARNFRSVSDDLKTISDDLRARDIGGIVERSAGRIDVLTDNVLEMVRNFQGEDGVTGGLMAEMRQTLSSAHTTMANMAENTEALKRNWFFRGFFNDRGFYDLSAVTVRDYQDTRFLADRDRVSDWLESSGLFAVGADGKERLTDDGRLRLDLAMARFLQYSKDDPLIIESWAGSGNEPERVLQSRERGLAVSDYLIRRFDLKPNYVTVMPMNAVASPDSPARDGVGLVLFAPRNARR